MRDWLRLMRQNWRLAFVALFAVAMTRLALWILPFRWLHRWSAGVSQRSGRGDIMRRWRIV